MKRRNLVFSAPAVLGTGLFTGLSTAQAASQPVIKFGQSASLSGGQAKYGTDVRDGILAAFAAASAADGPRGPRFELVTLDDGGVKDRCAKNVASLVDSDVSALIGLTSGAGAEACMSTVAQSQIPLLGTASGNMGIRANASGPTFHVRAGYDLEYRRMAAYVKDFGMRRIGVVYLQDTSKANLVAMTDALGAHSIVPKKIIAIDRNATSYDSVANELLAAQLDCVLFSTNAAPIAAVIGQMNEAKYPGLYYASSFAGQDLINTLVARKQSCIMSMVVPRPNSMAVNVVSRCQTDLAALGTGAKLGMTTLEGYIAGRTAVEAARLALKAGGERLTRSRMREALAGLRTDLGGYRVDFAAGTSQGSQYVDLIAIDRYGRLVG